MTAAAADASAVSASSTSRSVADEECSGGRGGGAAKTAGAEADNEVESEGRRGAVAGNGADEADEEETAGTGGRGNMAVPEMQDGDVRRPPGQPSGRPEAIPADLRKLHAHLRKKNN